MLATLVIAALVGLGMWVGSSFLKGNGSVTTADSELTASQHTMHLVRSLRISAASNTTQSNIDSIPESVEGDESLECGTRFTYALEDAVVGLHGIDYLSTVAGSRLTDIEAWRSQQAQSHDSAIALERLFPEECSPLTPVTFDLADDVRFSNDVSIRQMLQLSDDLVDEWSQLYLLAETVAEREIALAGLWQIISWESGWEPGRSPFTFAPS